jgi:glycine oxidase
MAELSHNPGLGSLAVEALRAYPEFVEGLEADSGMEVGFRRTGVLRVAFDEAEAVALREEVGRYEAAGLPSQWLGPESCRREEPGLGEVAGGLLSFDEAQVHAGLLLRALESALGRHTAIDDVEVVGIEDLGHEGGAVSYRRERAARSGLSRFLRPAQKASVDRRAASAVIIALGSWSGQLNAAHLPVRPVKGQLLSFGRVPGPRRILLAGHNYLLTKADGEVLLGGTMEEAGFSLDGTGEAQDLRRLLPRLYPQLVRQPATVRVGLRPATPDGLPVVGWVDGKRPIYAFSGHFRNGFLLAPLTARLAAAEIMEANVSPFLQPLRPDRFQPPA